MIRPFSWACCLAILACSSIAGADTYPRQPGVDAWHYVFRLELSDTSAEIVGETTADIRFTKDGVTKVALDLGSAANGKGMTVTSVTSAGKAVQFTHQHDVLTIALAVPSTAGRHVQFTIAYHGAPAGGLRILPNKHGDWSAFSENWPNHARDWLPMIDHPYDKATSEFVVTAPSKYQVVANGLLLEETDLGDDRRRTHWRQSVPIASWLNALGVEQFSVFHVGIVKGVELQTWVAHQDADAGRVYFEKPAREALEFYSEHIGPYAYEKLANVAAAGLNGGTEHASAIFYGENGVRPEPATSLVAHEIAHQWFGDSVTESDWDDVWLSEGFATYFTLLFAEHSAGREAFVSGLKASRTRAIATEKSLPGVSVIHDNLSDMSKVLNQLVYQKAGWVLHMLRGVVGTDAFWSGIREYYRRCRDGNASTTDFERVMEEASGKDLSWFFTQWLRRPTSPSFNGSWRYDPSRRSIDVEISQTQPGAPYRIPLEIGIATESGQVRVERRDLTETQSRFSIAVDKEPVAVTIDPNTWLLMDQLTFEKRQ